MKRALARLACFILLLSLLPHTTASRFAPLACPQPSSPLTAASALESAGDLGHSRACFLHAHREGASPAAALAGAQRVQLALLQQQPLPRGVSLLTFGQTFRSLMALMEAKNIMTPTELDYLASPFDVLILHGQLACTAEQTAPALASLHAALSIHDSSDVRELMARIALGRGDVRGALESVIAARSLSSAGGRHQAPAERAPALMLHLQALLLHLQLRREGGSLFAGNRTMDSGGVVSVSVLSAGGGGWGGGDGAEDDEEDDGWGDGVTRSARRAMAEAAADDDAAASVWREVRALVGARIASLGVELRVDDPLSPAPSASPPAFVAAAAAAAVAARRRGGGGGGAAAVAAPPTTAPSSLAPLLPWSSTGLSSWLQPSSSSSPDTSGWTAVATPSSATTFRDKGYVVLRSILPPEYARALLLRHLDIFFDGREGGGGGTRPPISQGDVLPRVEADIPQKRRSAWNEELSAYVGVRLLPAIEAIVGTRLCSVYAFSIAYSTGGVLYPHKDRAQNAISISINLGLQPPTLPPWPLYISPAGGGEAEGIPLQLAHNDALLYRGEHHTHFRRPLENGTSMQVILGYRDFAPGHCNSQ